MRADSNARKPVRMNKRILLGGLLWIPVALAEPASIRTVPLADVLELAVYSAPATVEARNEPQIAAEIDTRVLALPVQVGDRITAGDILAVLDCRSHESRLGLARAELEVARSQQRFAREQLSRARNLKKNKSISEELLDQRRAELDAREAEAAAREESVQQAAIDVEHCVVRAPFDATVMDRIASVGSYVARGQALVSLLEATGQEVSVALREDEIPALQNALQPVFETAANAFPVRLRALLPAMQPVQRTREARLAFVGEAALPGTPGRLTWRGSRMLLPAEYLVRRNGQLGIFVLHDERAKFLPIPGAQEGQPAAIDLAPDATLITEGRQSLNDMDAVSVRPARIQP